MKAQDLNPELAGQAIMKEEVPIGAKPIQDVDTFAMLVDSWHAEKMKYGNRLLQIPVDTEIKLEDEAKPGEVEVIILDEINMKIFRIGALSALQIFKNLPFGASIEEEPSNG